MQPAKMQCPPRCSRRSRLKFFAKLFFKKAGAQPAKVFWHTFFSKKPESGALAKSTPAARHLSWILLGEVGAPPQGMPCSLWAALARAIRARIAHRRALRLPVRLFGAFRRYSAGRGQAAAAPLSAPHKGRVERPLPLCYPHLCLARSYRAHASTSGEGLFN